MAYLINKFNGTELVVLQDGTIDSTTSISLVGKNYTGYGELQNENFVFLLENFANDAPPSRPIAGQLWFNTVLNVLNVYDGTKWETVGSGTIKDSAPENPPSGALWYDTVSKTLNIWTGSSWSFIGPEQATGFGITRARSNIILSNSGTTYPVIEITINDNVVAIVSDASFTIDGSQAISGFSNISKGLTLSQDHALTGNLNGEATTATRLTDPVNINGVSFDGSNNIVITANTPNSLVAGDFVLGNNFNGNAATTWSVDATSNNVIGKIVSRDSSGDFSAGTITADFVGNLTGNVTASSGTSNFDTIVANNFIGATLSGNANTATRLRTPRSLNGVLFDGTSDLTIPVDGNNVTGVRLANNVINSNLQSLGTLTNLNISSSGADIGSAIKITALSSQASISVENANGLNLSIKDAAQPSGYSTIKFISAAANLALGESNISSLNPDNNINLGSSSSTFKNIYADNFVGDLIGNADTATSAVTSTNIAGGGAGTIPYQTALGQTSFVASGTAGLVLRSGGSSAPYWGAITFSTLSRGSYLVGSDYNGVVNTSWSVDATSSNVSNKVVARDSNGDFSARSITSNLVGNVQGNSSTADKWSVTRILSLTGDVTGSAFIDGTDNISVNASVVNNSHSHTNYLDKSGGTMTGFVTLHSNPTSNYHASTKLYVDNQINSLSLAKAWVKFDGSSLSIVGSKNVTSVILESSGRYRIRISSGVFSNSHYAVAGLASDTDHFVVFRSSDATNLYINTVDNGSGNDSPSTTSGYVTVIMVD